MAQLAYWSLRRRVPLRGTSILRLRRAPSPRGYSYHMQYRTFISHPARYVAYERGKDPTASLPMTIRSSALHCCHTDRCVEGCLFEAHPSCAFGASLLQTITPCGTTVNENGFLLSLGWRRRHSSFPIGRLSPLSKLFWSPSLNHILSGAYAQ